MPIIKCKMCGGDVVLADNKTVGICEYCGSMMTFPKIDDDQRAAAFNRGNHFRRIGEFDKALEVYEHIVAEDDTDAEAHWCCALCRFGIEWVEDPNTLEYVPTCHRASFDSFLEDVDYLAALQYSDGVTRRQYQRDGAKIAEVQRAILATSRNEKPFDVFICYKELDDVTGERTRDSIDAQEIYYNLTQEGYRVFFSRITLEDKVGTEYEPYIFAALNSAKVMVVLGSKPEYFSAVWVKNEWSRFLTLMRRDRSKLLLPCYKNMDPYDLPDQLSVLMSYDMTRIGFMQDLLRGIRKVLRKDEPKPAAKETVIVQQSTGPNVDSLLRRAYIFLEDEDWQSADDYCERVLDQSPENALAYLGKLMVELRVSSREKLRELEEPFDNRTNYHRAIRYGDEALRDELEGDNAAIRARIEEKRKAGIYAEIQRDSQRARTEADWLAVAERFAALSGFRDAGHQAELCRKKAETARKAALYDAAAAAMSAANTPEAFESAAKMFEEIPGFRDSEQKAANCRAQADTLRQKAEEERRRRREEEQRKEEEKKHRQAEEAEKYRLAAERAATEQAAQPKAAPVVVRSKKKAAPILITIAAILIVAGGLLMWKLPVIKQEQAYRNASALLEAGEYAKAVGLFADLGDYKDSAALCAEATYQDACARSSAIANEENCNALIAVFESLGNYRDSEARVLALKYQRASLLLTNGAYGAAIEAFTALGDYKDSVDKISEAQAAILEDENATAYAKAEALRAAGEFDAAVTAFEALGSYRDSADQIPQTRYIQAISLAENGDYEAAVLAFEALGDYGDSADQIMRIRYAEAGAFVEKGDYNAALNGYEALGDYLDSVQRAEELYYRYVVKDLFSADVGNVVLFGSYEQDNNAENGKEDIEWLVLAKEDGKLLVISKYALDCQPYNKYNSNVTWDRCTLRNWLNEVFLNAAFSREEQSIIHIETVNPDKTSLYDDQGSATKDKVFLLSKKEALQLFYSDESRQCVPTSYAIAQGASTSKRYNMSGEATCWWWTRSRDNSNWNEFLAYVVLSAGSAEFSSGMQVDSSTNAVRPAMWITVT